jgi:hypothetical protein
MNVNNLKPPRHDKAMSMWRGAGILMGNLVLITCIYGVFYLLLTTLNRLYNFQSVLFLFKNYIGI